MVHSQSLSALYYDNLYKDHTCQSYYCALKDLALVPVFDSDCNLARDNQAQYPVCCAVVYPVAVEYR